MNVGLNYDDVVLVPDYFNGASRSEITLTSYLYDFGFKLPVVPANMKCTIDFSLAEQLSDNGYFYVLHRFYEYDKIFEWVKKNQNRVVSISIGVQQKDTDLIRKIMDNNLKVDFITIDIAHGHCSMMQNMIELINYEFNSQPTKPKTRIIAGNIGTVNAARDLVNWGADVVKVGLAYGRACITKDKTGFATPMFSTIKEIRNYLPETSIIADGGIRCNGDIAKAIAAGADFVMMGSMIAACTDSPAENVYWDGPELEMGTDGKYYMTKEAFHKKDTIVSKKYYGSASAKNKGHSKNVEGKEILVDHNNMTILEKYDEITQDLQSAVSYSGCSDIYEFQSSVKYQMVK